MTIGKTMLAALGCLVAVACGGTDGGSGFEELSPAPPLSGAPGSLGGDADSEAAKATPASACATATATGEALPVYLVFMYDRSGSMKNDAKWSSAKAAMESFFIDPATKGVSASLAFFAQPAPGTCSPDAYATPAVAMAPLPDGAMFHTALDAVSPGDVGGGTPTLPAAAGAVKLAQKVAAEHAKDGRVAIVLVTDGEPNGCNSTPANVAAELAKVRATIPTYVIGVGSKISNLDTIAEGGGTAPAIRVETTSPAETTAEFTKALDAIKRSALACEYAVPAAPAGSELDLDTVNVAFTPAGGATRTLPYDRDCTGGEGWHYDDPSAPTRIVMCGTTCDALKAASGKIDVFLGCTTEGGLR